MVSRLFICLVLLSFTVVKAHAQLRAVSESLSLEDSSSIAEQKRIRKLIRFPNINRTPYYSDKRDLQAIKKYSGSDNDEALYPILYEYVSKFGVENFFKDNQLLWQLASLEAKKGDTLAAIQLYKLVLKHYRDGMDMSLIKDEINQLPVENKENYVPLKYYYELVEFRKEIDTLRPPQGVYLNMGNEINSNAGDYGPALSPDNAMMLFTSKRNTIKQGLSERENEDLMFSRNESGYWTPAKPLTPVNSPYNEGSATISPQGDRLVFTRCSSPDGLGSCDLYISKMQEDGSWSTAENLGKAINSIYWDSHPSFSHSGDTLFFVSDRPGGFGMTDIYFTHKTGTGIWSAPQNMGPVINTRGSEVSPFYHPGHHVFYFSSNGHLLNFGEFDIYKSNRLDNIWGEPKNIGPLVNGQGSEFYFTIDAQSQNLYYARSVEDKMANLDLYSFPLPMEAQPLATTNLKGSLRNEETGKPFSNGIVSIIDLDNGVEVAPKFLKPDGSFEFELINENNYLIIIQGDEFFRLEEIFFLNGDKEFHREVASVSSRLKFENMKFDNGKAELKTSMFADLDKIIDFLLDNPDFMLKIEGHTDSDGNPDLNLDLSQRRADAIKEYLVEFGKLDASRVEAIGYGSTKPIVEEKTEKDKQLNRRVEFNIIRQ
ncbi:outer membrane protein OmpA-like peptidoglycan-associated protein [Catalinimonas alkaloidigena]|uniref:OmpA family protein n=1 Tax=Catalinimonas alkaloidigena TaxID=1075417 RepID=UPI0024075E99|nr:OmpA family protein [Catalinimonas alkaloidigena]MDF9795935.1 outer membrane protein OmpA-like peptidoglycan-associated protein [Catalinimonas alkaloidigena]